MERDHFRYKIGGRGGAADMEVNRSFRIKKKQRNATNKEPTTGRRYASVCRSYKNEAWKYGVGASSTPTTA